MKTLSKKFSNKYKENELRQEKEGTYIQKMPQRKIFGSFNKAINLNKLQ